MKNKIKYIFISILFLILSDPSILSADSKDSKNIWQDNSCITELRIRNSPLMKKYMRRYSENGRSPFPARRQHVSQVFVGEVIWAQPREEVDDMVCGMGIGYRYVRHNIIEVLMGDLKAESELKISHHWCEFYEERFPIGAKFIIGLNTRINRAPEQGEVAWELPFNSENREKAKNFIQCIRDKGIVKAMEKESE